MKSSHSEAIADVEKPDLPAQANNCSTSNRGWRRIMLDFLSLSISTELRRPVLGETPFQMGDKDEKKDAELEESMIHEPASSGGSPVGGKQSPKVQLMHRSEVPDPNRIPASVFARNKSEMPMEWSVASNESLFSIPMKSGDLSGLCSNNFDVCPPSSYGAGTPPGKGRVGSCLQQIVEAPNPEGMKDKAEESEEKDKPATIDSSPHSDSTSQHSDAGSVSSNYSFAFPILTPEERNRSCKAASEQHRPEQPLTPSESEKTEVVKVESVATSRRSWVACFCCSFCC